MPGIKVDAMEVMLPGLQPPSRSGIGPLFKSGSPFPLHTIDWVSDVL